MKIALDASGHAGDLAPLIAGARRAAANGLEIVLYGPADELEAALRPEGPGGLRVADARFLEPAELDPNASWRENPDASTMRAAEAVVAGQAQALVSGAAPPVVVSAAAWHLKRLPGVLRPALVAAVPTPNGPKYLLDAGAQADCKPWHLLQFAVMGSIYAQRVGKIEAPRVGLLTASADRGLGEAAAETLPLLKYGGVDFAGPATGADLAAGSMDVFVTEGALGDVALKLHAGLSNSIFEMLESLLQSSPIRQVGGALAKGAFSGAKETFHGAASGGAPLLGLGGPVVAVLDARSADAVFNALGLAATVAASDVNERIRDRLVDMKSDMEFARVRD